MSHDKKNFLTYDLFLFLLLVVFVTIISLINPAFFSFPTLFDVIRNQTLYILLAFALLPVVILGGFDISFVAVASLSTFLASRVLTYAGYEGGIWLFYVVGIAFGIAAGLGIGGLISAFKLGIFELSLGMTPLIYGLLTLFSVSIPSHGHLKGLDGWSMKWLVTVQSAAGQSGLHISVIAVIITFIVLSIFLRYSTLGRAIYAMGSDKSVAIRTGIDIKKIYLPLFAITGALAANAGITSSGLGMGSYSEKFMKIYATVIIGGASIHGGKGSVFGTMMGVLLVGIINQALVYLRIPTAWGEMVLGVIFIAFVSYQILERRLNK
jgi:simple sugar transport system permease protein